MTQDLYVHVYYKFSHARVNLILNKIYNRPSLTFPVSMEDVKLLSHACPSQPLEFVDIQDPWTVFLSWDQGDLFLSPIAGGALF